MTFGEKVIAFYKKLDYSGDLPDGVEVMNPFKDNPKVENITGEFYSKFFSDDSPRYIILGINPGRFGAGSTGIPFTDTIRLNGKCGIRFDELRTYETSSVFVYEMIEAWGGVQNFYGRFLISAVCPLGFTIANDRGKSVNYNYYDSREMLKATYSFIITTLKQQMDFGIRRSACICLGTGKNVEFLRNLNNEYRLFDKIIPLEHPRFIMQYKASSKNAFIRSYLSVLNSLE